MIFKKVLVIDYMSPSGHKNFDKIHVESLLELNCNLKIVGKRGHFTDISNKQNIEICELPNWCCSRIKYLKPLFVRIQSILALLYIRAKYAQNDYDYTIFLCYDILSIFFYRTVSNVILIDHNNVGQLKNKVKLFLTKNYPDYAHIALNKQMCQKLRDLLPEHNVFYIPHGLVPAFTNTHISEKYANSENFLFCPVNQNFDQKKIASLFNNDFLLDYLKEKNLVLYVKFFVGIREDRKEIQVISERLSEEDYKYLIKNSLAVILPYTEEFKYRCSGIMFECVANDTTLICYTNPAISIFNGEIDMYEFETSLQLVDCINARLNNGRKFYNKEFLNPTSYWRDFFKVK